MSPSATPTLYTRAEEADLPALARLMHFAFASELDGAEKWLRESGLEHVRAVRTAPDATPSACLLRIPMGQYFGGTSVPMLGIAGVAASPETRGRGVARAMMTHAMQEAATDGFAISCLYASTLGLYRQVGYEQAGHQFTTTIPLGRIDVRERAGDIRPLTDADEPAIRECYARFAPAFNGMLDRDEYCWRRVRNFRGTPHSGFGVIGDSGHLDGYLFLTQVRDGHSGFHDLSLTDVVFTTPAAGRRLLGFLADFATMGESVSIPGGPLHPITSLMSLRQTVASKRDYWMIRILDLAAAIERRGYPAQLTAEVGLRITDDIIPGNAGDWRIRVEAGSARATRQTLADRIECDIRGLASIYSGLYSARQAAMLGWVGGTDRALAAAHLLFGSGGSPWMTDRF